MDDPSALEPSLDTWSAWTPAEVAERLRGIELPWYVAAGWAIDLFLGRNTREHEDLEIAVPQARFEELLPRFTDGEFFVVGECGAVPYASAGPLRDANHQTWWRDDEGWWRVDVFREPSAAGMWVSRRDDRLTLPYESLILRTAEGIPYACPEVVLLFKAKAARPKDEMDLEAVLPHLSQQRLRWLRDALQLVHPGHRWLSRMA